MSFAIVGAMSIWRDGASVIAPRLTPGPEKTSGERAWMTSSAPCWPGLAAERVRLRVDDEVGRVRAVEELRDALVRERVACCAPARRTRVLASMPGKPDAFDAASSSSIVESALAVLVLDRVLADLLDDAILVAAAVGRVEALEADHAARGPDLVRAVAVGDDDVGLRARGGVGEDGVDGAVAGLVLVRVEPLAAQPLRRRRAWSRAVVGWVVVMVWPPMVVASSATSVEGATGAGYRPVNHGRRIA